MAKLAHSRLAERKRARRPLASPTLLLRHHLAIRALNGGLFISRGRGTHPVRTINSHELIVVRSGKLSMFEAQRQFTLRRGDCLWLRPGVQHGGAAPYPQDLSFFWVHFLLTPTPSRGRTKSSRLSQVTSLGQACQGVFELLTRFLDDQQRQGDVDMNHKRSLLLALILAEIEQAADASTESATPMVHSELAQRARELIVRRALEPQVKTAAIAQELSCNVEYLSRVFRQTFSHTLTHEIHSVRIRHARRLLIESTLGIKQIAAECGFGDEAFFRDVFRRHTGSSPAEFRRCRSAIHVNTQ